MVARVSSPEKTDFAARPQSKWEREGGGECRQNACGRWVISDIGAFGLGLGLGLFRKNRFRARF